MTSSAWSPLRHSVFRVLWIASVASNVGSTMHDVGAAWLMTSLAPSSPILVALMQTASSLPIFLVALPAGALADLVDRRLLLLITQGWMLVAAAALGGLTVAHLMTPLVLLSLTFLLGLGGALNAPAWQAITPELVPRNELHTAITLNGVGFNLARAVGPAIGGLIVAAAGSGAVFLLNSVSFVAVIVVLYRWQRAPKENMAPAERLLGAIRAGNRYVRHAPALRAVLVRTGVFILFGSAVWALLPILASSELKLSAAGYGTLLGCFGLGAVVAANILPGVRRRASTDRITLAAALLFALVAIVLSVTHTLLIIYPTLFCGGGAWMTIMSTFNLAAQTAVPGWVRARALAAYLLVFQGGLAIGSACWGAIATHFGIQKALLFAGGGLILGLVVVPRFRLAPGEGMDLAPSQHWDEPVVESEPHPEDGPVLITVEYRVEPEQAAAFAEAMRPVGMERRRDGAYRWGLFQDVADGSRWIETFVVESWAEHLRQHERVTESDRVLEANAAQWRRSDVAPVVSHYMFAYRNSGTPDEPAQ